MTLRNRILIALIAIAVIPLALFGVIAYRTATNNLEVVERDALKSGLESANQALRTIQDNLAQYLRDYSQWDELHNISALDEVDLEWITINLAPETPSSTYNTFNLDIIAVWNYQTRLLWEVGLAEDIAARLKDSIKIEATVTKPQTLLLPSGTDIYLVGFATIFSTMGTDPNGILMFGRKLGPQDTQAISVLTGYDVALYSGRKPVIAASAERPDPATNDLELAAKGSQFLFNQSRQDFALAFAPIQNVNGEQVATLVMWRPRTALQTSQEVIRTTLVLVFAIGAILAILVAMPLGASIVSPLNAMAAKADLIAAGDLKQRITSHKTAKDELARLSSAFNRMTSQLALTIDNLNHTVQEIDEKNRALQVATAKAQELARVRGEFLATMSHELRTPLNAIIGFSDVLLMGVGGPLNPMQLHQVERLKDNGKRLLALINDVLDISRIEAGRIEIVSEPFALGRMIERVVAQMRVLAEQKPFSFTTVISPDLPPMLIGDEKRIEQVIVNLLSNAFKFTEAGSVTFEARVLPADKQWVMTVADTGIGIPPHALDLIFEPFRQVDGSSKRAYKGSGLGLAIAQQLVQSMGGQITVESTLGQGSTFTVNLPLRLPETPERRPLELQEA